MMALEFFAHTLRVTFFILRIGIGHSRMMQAEYTYIFNAFFCARHEITITCLLTLLMCHRNHQSEDYNYAIFLAHDLSFV